MPTIHDILAGVRPRVQRAGGQKVIPPRRVAPAPSPVVDEAKLPALNKHLRAIARGRPDAVANFKAALSRSKLLRAAAAERSAKITDRVCAKSSVDARIKQILTNIIE